MGNSYLSYYYRPASAVVLLAVLTHAAAAQVVSTSFQNGIDDYSGTFDRRISTDVGAETLGADDANFFFDGINDSGSSPDTQGLIRFDTIVGTDIGQIRIGATILDARLTVNTSVRGNAQTSGPYGVSGLLQRDNWLPFDELTSYEDFEANLDSEALTRGAWWQDGYATRPVGGFGFQLPGQPDSANVTSIVQGWVDGSLDNHGLVIQAGRSDTLAEPANTSDGWAIRTTGFPIADTRPELEVDYTVEPIIVNSFQDGINSYAGTTMAIVRSGTNALIEDVNDPVNPEITENGADLDQSFLDGVQFADVNGNTDSPDDFALLQFDKVFGSEEGQAPGDIPVAKAWAVLTTGDIDANSRSSGPWAAHTMLRPWDTTSLHSSFGDINGLQVDDGDIGEALDTLDGFIRGAEVWFDVTDYLEGVRNGADDNGIAVMANGTADGWQIHTNGSMSDTNGSTTESARPRLLVYSGEISSGVIGDDCNGDGVVDIQDANCTPDELLDDFLAGLNPPSLRGDADGDGTVQFSDFVVLSNNFGNAGVYTEADFDKDGTIQFDDFVILSNSFGQSGGGAVAAVPEPTTGLLAYVALIGWLAIAVRRARD